VPAVGLVKELVEVVVLEVALVEEVVPELVVA